MSGNNLETAISILQHSPDPRGTLKALISIRSEVDWPKNKHNIARLRERGCLKQITGVLLSANQKNCIDLALSILGNCLMDRTCTSEVVAQHNIISVLNQVLKKYPKEDSINGRTFRIVGNMCQHRDQWATIIIDKKPFIISHIVEIIKRAANDEPLQGEKITEATVVTALRALRELLNCHTVMGLVRQFGVLKAIGALFIKYSIQWQENQQNEKMLVDIVRVIQEYSRFKYYHSIIELRNTYRGDSLVHLSSVLILAPRRIVKIVMNFIRSCQLQSELPIPEICDKFVNVLEKHSLKEFEGTCTELLQCLCYLLYHPANRNHERCGRAVPLLIKVLKEFEEISNNVIECCMLLIHTLNKFKYDDRLMLEQLQHGIIPVLISKLSWIVEPPDVLNFKHTNEKKRKYMFGQNSPALIKRKLLHNDTLKECGNSPNSSDDEFEMFRFKMNTRSPSPCSSSDESVNALSWSEYSSSPNRSFVNNNDSDSDNYSPVCSEADESEFPLPHDCINDFPDPLPPVPDLGDSMDNDIEDGSTSGDSKRNILGSLKIGLCQEIVKLLKSYIKLRPPHPQLANVDLLLQLTKCAVTEQFDVKDVICDIIKSHEYLIPLLQSGYIQTLDEMRTIPPNHDTCSKCSLYGLFTYTILRRFGETAESGVGKGDIAHQLLRGDMETRQKLVMVIPYVIGNRSILGKLMLNCGGLNILMKLLQENNEQDNQRSLKVLCQMASNCLLIANPRKTLPTRLNRPKISADKYKLSENCNNVVTFEFDDGAIIKADREFLIEKSEFFNGLLNGHFKESEQSQINLSNVEAKSFRCMLHLLASVDKNQAIEIDLDLETLLDVIMLCDRYLLVDLCVFLTDSVEQFRIDTDTVPTIYNWSVESGTNLLRVESVAFALVATVDEHERFKMFQDLFNLGYKDQLIEDIEKLLKRYLSLSDFNQRVKDLNSKRKHLKEKMRDRLLKHNATTPLASIFITLHHNVTGEQPGELPLYLPGFKDTAAVFFYSLICIIVHAIIQEYILDKVSKKLHLSKSKLAIFSTSGQLFAFYLVSAIWGVDIALKEHIIPDIARIWSEYPPPMFFMFKMYILVQLAYSLHELPELYFQRVKREEWANKAVQSLVSLVLVTVPYVLNFNRLLVFLLVLHHVAEWVYHLAQLLQTVDKEEKFSKVARLASTILQIVARLGSIILAVLTLWYGLALHENQSLDVGAGQFNTPTVRFSVLAGIILLQMYLIFKVISQEISRTRENASSAQPVPKAKQQKKEKPKKTKKNEESDLPEVDQNTNKTLRKQKVK